MSWNAITKPVAVRDVAEALAAATVFGTVSPERDEQVATAKHCAVELAASGAIGGSGDLVIVNISGHANPGHKPAPGWADDQISITIRQVQPTDS